MRIIVAMSNVGLTPGHYEFPFKFQLPINIPGSFYNSSGSGNNQIHFVLIYK